jgi:hypothetical protein
MSNHIVQARVNDQVLEQLATDAATLGLESTSAALREGIELLHRKASQVRLARSYDDFYGGAPAPLSEVTSSLWGHPAPPGESHA